MSRVRRQDPIKCCYLGSYRKAGKKRLRSWPRLENEETASRSNKETDQACRRASCHAMTQPASPSTPSGPAAISTNEGDRSRATKTRQVHPLPTPAEAP